MADIKLLVDTLSTPLGPLYLGVTEAGTLRRMTFREPELHAGAATVAARDPFGLTRAMQAYFDGETLVIDNLRAEGEGTAFQRDVWRALRAIPTGQTTSYGEVARRIGRPKACRAVGAANGANPIAIVVPCHRVIGGNQALVGYAGGLPKKRWLLAHEARFSPCSLGPLFEQPAQEETR